MHAGSRLARRSAIGDDPDQPLAGPWHGRWSIIDRVSTTAIRPLELDDADGLAALYARNREFLRPFEPDRDDAFFTPEGQRARVEQALEGARAGTRFGYAILDAGEEIAGVLGLENVIRGASRSATVSYWVDRGRNGRGLASRAVAEIAEIALTDLVCTGSKRRCASTTSPPSGCWRRTASSASASPAATSAWEASGATTSSSSGCSTRP